MTKPSAIVLLPLAAAAALPLLLATVPGASAFAPSSAAAKLTRFAASRSAPTPASATATTTATRLCSAADAATATAASDAASQRVLASISDAVPASKAWGDMFELDGPEATFHAVFSGIRNGATLGLSGTPFVLRGGDGGGLTAATTDMAPLAGFYTYDDLTTAVEEDFLDADRGSTDNKRGWKVANVSKPRGDSFEDARMTREEIDAALAKGTVILSAAGAHVPKLAGPTLACTDAAALPCALNLYVTAAGKRTSAPPHTDRQDVAVVQTQGRKHWRVYSPPDAAADPSADMFARGKGDDDLPLPSLNEGRFGSELLLDVTLEPGDVLFVPAAFPHTTDTAGSEEGKVEDTSVHLTFNFDTHVWDLDYLSARRLALRRSGVTDWKLCQFSDTDNRYVGFANEVPKGVRTELFRPLPLGLLDDELDEEGAAALAATAASELERISHLVDEETASQVLPEVWSETIEALRTQGLDLMDVHRDMYLAAVEEGRTRRSERDMTAHLKGEALARARAMTPDKMQRLSVFRVRDYFAKINVAKAALLEWSRSGAAAAADAPGGGGGSGGGADALPDNWEFTLPLSVGDQVEADLGGAFFEAMVTKVAGSTYDVQFFDGDVMDGMSRDMIKLLTPPAASANEEGGGEDAPPPGLTKKELKRWHKQQEKKAAKN